MIPKLLTIAGSDSGGGAGIQADLKTFYAHGCYGMSVITALTAQNTRGVTGVVETPGDFVGAQLDAVLSDIGCDGAKTGMLASATIIAVVAEKLALYSVPNLVVDPVMISKSGHALLQPEAMDALKTRLIPMARLITPNAHEAAALLGRPVKTIDDARRASADLRSQGPRAVLVKGGHLEETDQAVDVLCDAEGIIEFAAPRLNAKHTHGTGCTLSAAIAANLALGKPLRESIAAARNWLREAIKTAFEVGSGISPVNHLQRMK